MSGDESSENNTSNDLAPPNQSKQAQGYNSFSEFYPFYLSQHENITCRRLHFVGTSLVILLFALSLWTRQWRWLLLTPFVGYGLAWVGHFFYEKNRPATFTYPVFSLMGDWLMFKDILVGKVKI